MNRVILIASFAFTCFTNNSFGQDIPQSQVPSVIVNNFQQAFPKASDVEWELKGDTYKVDFEIGLFGTDHDAQYDKTGKLVCHKEEIAKSKLPQKVLNKIRTDFRGFRVDDVKKITKGNNVSYTMELKTFTEEWKVAFDNAGNVLSKMAD